MIISVCYCNCLGAFVTAYIMDDTLFFIMDRFVDELCDRLRELGYQSRMISIDHLHLLQEQIGEQHSQGLLDDQFYQERLGWFRFEIPEGLPKARSMIVVAVPRPQTRAVFTWDGIRRPLILPPTYTAYKGITEHVENLLAKLLGEKGYSVSGTALPLKLLAVRSGLGEYGKNNLCYVSGMGSFLQLVAVYSDMPCEEDSWREASCGGKNAENFKFCGHCGRSLYPQSWVQCPKCGVKVPGMKFCQNCGAKLKE